MAQTFSYRTSATLPAFINVVANYLLQSQSSGGLFLLLHKCNIANFHQWASFKVLVLLTDVVAKLKLSL